MTPTGKNIVLDKAYVFAIQIVNTYKLLTNEKKEYVMSKQLLRSGTAVGALIKEAEHAQSKADFLNKMNIALKEANETEYWIELLRDTDYLTEEEIGSLLNDISQILKLLISIVKTTKTSLNR